MPLTSGDSPISTVTGVTILGPLSDIATVNVSPTVTAGQSIPIDADGWVLLVQFDSAVTIADPTKLTVNITRPGYTSVIGGAATTRTDTALGVKQIRRVYPNNGSVASPIYLVPGSANAFYIVIDNLIHTVDVVSSIVFALGFFTGQSSSITIGTGLVTNTSTITYGKPIVRPVFKAYDRMGPSGSFPVEFVAIHEWAAFGSQVARVEARCKVAGVYGAWSGTSVHARSPQTPVFPGRCPSRDDSGGFGGVSGFDSYSFSVSGAGCADGAGDIVWRAYGWYGDTIWDSETDGAVFSLLLTAINIPGNWPFVKDVANLHSRIYAYVNRDGTGLLGTVATGVSASSVDPGTSASYTNYATAAAAARLYNNNIANRATVHNDTSGLVILLRDVTGTLGDSTTAYWQRAAMTGFSDGLMPIVLASASYLSTGTTSLNCRIRGVQDDGATAVTSRQWNGRVETWGLKFDSTSTAGTNHQLFDGASVAGLLMSRVDCDLHDVNTTGTSYQVYRWGLLHDFRVSEGGLNTTDGIAGYALYNLALSVGSSYAAGSYSATRQVQAQCLCSVWFRQLLVLASGDGAIMYGFRGDYDSSTTAPIRLGLSPTLKGLGLCNMMVRLTTLTGSPAMQVGADDTLYTLLNVVIQNLTVYGARFNYTYGDQGWIQVIKRSTLRASAIDSFNNKSDYYVAPETTNSNSVGWVASTAYSLGSIVHDNNVTLTARIYYQALANTTTTTAMATDFAVTATWQQGATGSTSTFGSQPRRTGNWRARHQVRSYGNVIAASSSDTAIGPISWMGEVKSRLCLMGIASATISGSFKRLSTTLSDYGDFRPKSLAAGDASDADMLNRVAANYSVTPHDLLGQSFRTDGTGASGAFERLIANATTALTALSVFTTGGAFATIGAGPLAATSALSSTASGSASGAGVLTAAPSITTSSTAAMIGFGAIAATASLVTAGAPSLFGAGTLAASSVVTTASSIAATGYGQVSSSSVFTTVATGTTTGTGTLTAASNLTTVSSAALAGLGSVTAFSTVTTAATGTQSGYGTLSASAAVATTGSGAATGYGPLTSASLFATGVAGTLLGSGSVTAIAATSASSLTVSATLIGTGTLSGASALSFASSGTFVGYGALTGTSAFITASSGVTTGAGALAGSSAISTFATATPTGAGALTSGAAVTTGISATLFGYGAILASSAFTTATSSSATGTGALIASSALMTSGTGTVNGLGSIVSTASIATFATGSILGAGTVTAITGVSASTVAVAGTLTGTGTLAASSAFAFGSAVSTTGYGPLTATSALTTGTTFTPTGAGILAATSLITTGAGGTPYGFGQLAAQTTMTIGAAGILANPSLTGTPVRYLTLGPRVLPLILTA